MYWRKFNGDAIHLPIKEAVAEAIERETAAGFKLKVCIGTDSQVKGKETEFATVIVFLREGHGGFMFLHNDKTLHKYSIKERMLVEVAKSIEIAYELEARHRRDAAGDRLRFESSCRSVTDPFRCEASVISLRM